VVRNEAKHFFLPGTSGDIEYYFLIPFLKELYYLLLESFFQNADY
jgi:hypothetical protein